MFYKKLIRSISSRLPAVPIRHHKTLPRRYILSLAAIVVSRESVRPGAGSAGVEKLAKTVGVQRGTAVRVGNTGDAAVVGVGATVAVEVDVTDVGEVIDAVAID